MLYDNNRILISIEMGGVYTHGLRCGRYHPAERGDGVGPLVTDFGSIVWPQFLRKMRLLYIDIPDGEWKLKVFRSAWSGLSSIPPSLRKAVIGNVLYSLCNMLRGDHHQWLAIGSNLGLEKPTDLKTTYYPMRFLGFASVSMSRYKRDQICSLVDARATGSVHTLRKSDRKAKIVFLKRCMDIITLVAVDHQGSRFLEVCGKILAAVIVIGAGVIAGIDPDTGEDCYASARVFTNTIKFIVMELRMLLETNDISKRSEELQAQIEFLLRFDIELRATPTPKTKTTKNAAKLKRREHADRLLFPGPQPEPDRWSRAPIILRDKGRGARQCA